MDEAVSTKNEKMFSEYLHSIERENIDLFQDENTIDQSQTNQQVMTSVGRLKEFSRRHIQKVVCEQLQQANLSIPKWEKILSDLVITAVEQVKPSTRMLNDLMEINEYIKIKLIDWKDQGKSCYINGIVMSKSVVNRRMATRITDPRILLLKKIADLEVTDLASKLDQEEHTNRIIHQKLSEIKPDLVIIQKDISVKLVNMLKQKQITVVANLEERKLRRLARLTQTIVLPSLNVIDQSFNLGKCKIFREDNLTRQLRDLNLKQPIQNNGQFQHG